MNSPLDTQPGTWPEELCSSSGLDACIFIAVGDGHSQAMMAALLVIEEGEEPTPINWWCFKIPIPSCLRALVRCGYIEHHWPLRLTPRGRDRLRAERFFHHAYIEFKHAERERRERERQESF